MKFRIEGELDEGQIIINTPDVYVVDDEPDPQTPEEKPQEEEKTMLKVVGGKK